MVERKQTRVVDRTREVLPEGQDISRQEIPDGKQSFRRVGAEAQRAGDTGSEIDQRWGGDKEITEDLARTPATPDRPSRQRDRGGVVDLMVAGEEKSRPLGDGDRGDRAGRCTGARGQLKNTRVHGEGA